MSKILIATALLFFVAVTPVVAQININYVNSSTFALGDADLEQTTIRVVQWVLTLLGLIAVIMIIASVVIGATTSDSDRAAAAKRALIGAVIGLVIVLLAWAIVAFVTNTTSNVTT